MQYLTHLKNKLFLQEHNVISEHKDFSAESDFIESHRDIGPNRVKSAVMSTSERSECTQQMTYRGRKREWRGQAEESGFVSEKLSSLFSALFL